MKFKVLAVLVAASAASLANAAEIYNKDGNKLDLYGKAVARHYFSDNKNVDGDATYIRFGFKGETRINDSLTGFGQWEYNIQANNPESSDSTVAQKGNKTRLGFAGLKFADFGSIDYGRNYGVVFDVASITDTPVIFDNQTFTNTDNFMTGRGNGFLTYRNNDFFGLVDGFKFSLQYQGANNEGTNNSRGAMQSNGDGYGMSASYDIGYDISVLGAYASSKRTDRQNLLTQGEGERADIWASGLKYDNGNLYLAATYAQAYNLTPISSTQGYANKSQNLELVAKYAFDNGITPEVGYFRSKGKDLDGNVGDQDILHYWDFSLAYYLNKNMSVYVDYKLNRINKDNNLGLASDDQTGLGMTYQF